MRPNSDTGPHHPYLSYFVYPFSVYQLIALTGLVARQVESRSDGSAPAVIFTAFYDNAGLSIVQVSIARTSNGTIRPMGMATLRVYGLYGVDAVTSLVIHDWIQPSALLCIV